MSGLTTRKPTGRPAWPLVLLAGAEKSGKSWAAAEASKSPLIGTTYWIGCGEDDPDELGRVGDFLIVEHNGSYPAIVDAITEINRLDQQGDKPTLIILDSISMVWAMLTDEAQAIANTRAARKAARSNKPAPQDDVAISMDLWNRAAKRWRRLMDALRAHQGPVILTARLSLISILANGEPTGEKEYKIEGHKTLPYDVSAIVQLRSRSERYITGVRSVVWATEPDALIPFPTDAGVADLWAKLGLEEATDRVHRSNDANASIAAEDKIRADLLRRLAAVAPDMGKLEAWWENNHQEPLAEASDLAALLAVVETGEKRHAEHKAPAKPAPQGQVDTLPEAPEDPPAERHEARPEKPAAAGKAIEDKRRESFCGHIATILSGLGITDRPERLFYTAQLAGLPNLDSTKDLTTDEMREVLKQLDGMPDRGALEAHLADKETPQP